MGKKNPNRFTIGFNKDKPSHQRVVDILNQASDKAEFIAEAVLCYVGENDSNMPSGMNFGSLQPFIKELVEQEVQKAVGGIREYQKREEPEIMDLTTEDAISVDEELAQELFTAMDIFRKT